jgi:ADP-ribosyl-[dinitrogen reductase] hydrolase
MQMLMNISSALRNGPPSKKGLASRSMTSKPKPIPNSYWLPGGKIVAGEYPGDPTEPKTREKIAALLKAGVTAFIDLTSTADGMVSYKSVLADEARKLGVNATRISLPVRDMDVPTNAEMVRILDIIEDFTDEGRIVYLHCWGGVGRTGMVAACHLVRGGSDCDAALDKIRELFATMTPDKVKRHRGQSPQTDAQIAMVREWTARDPRSRRKSKGTKPERSLRDRYVGSLIGLATGDALGTTLEFKKPGTFTPLTDMTGGGPFALEPGQWTDDTSMAMCLAESLTERGRFDAEDQMKRYKKWRDKGHWSSTGKCFDIGNTTRDAIDDFSESHDAWAGTTDENTAGNGSLMRVAPVALFFAKDAEKAIRKAGDSSRTTHGRAVAVDACRYMTGLILGALKGLPKETLFAPNFSPVPGLWDREPLHPAIAAIANGSFLVKKPPQIRGTGYVVDSLEAALWAFASTRDFESGVLAAVNLGDDADTTGAVYGQLAGAWYGVEAIPKKWREKLTRVKDIEAMALRLLETST